MTPGKILLAGAVFLTAMLSLDRYLCLARVTPPILKYYNDEFGSLNNPNIKYLKVKESFFMGETNYDGRFRENYPKRRTDSKTLRIILVGDSFVEGIDVFSRNHFAALMEREMSSRLGRKVEILNFGRGNCTLQPSSFYYFNYIKKEYDADLVLLFTESRDLEATTDFPSSSFIYDTVSGGLVESALWKESTDYKLTKMLDRFGLLKVLNESGWFRLAYRTRSGISMYGLLPKLFGKFYGEVKGQTYDLIEVKDSFVSKTTEKIFDTLSRETLPPVWFVLRNFPLESRGMHEYMMNKGFNFIDLTDTLDHKIIRGTQVDAYYFKTTATYGGHWNYEGHIAVGHFLSNRLVSMIQSGRITIPH